MEMIDLRPKLKDFAEELSKVAETIVENTKPKNQNSSYYREAILANLNRAIRELTMAVENTRFYTNADNKPTIPISEK